MGYTTDFEGSFQLSKKLTLDQAKTLRDFSETRHDEDDDQDIPGAWCQWTPTNDGMGIEWDGNEKFYDYVEWLQYIIDKFLIPWNISLNGEVSWIGEDHGDAGIITVTHNKIKTRYLV